jgi:hypothetical protein
LHNFLLRNSEPEEVNIFTVTPTQVNEDEETDNDDTNDRLTYLNQLFKEMNNIE